MKIVFVKRPSADAPLSVMDALRLTAKNGKAVQLRRSPAYAYPRLEREHLLLRTTRRGKFILAWCENGARAKKGGR